MSKKHKSNVDISEMSYEDRMNLIFGNSTPTTPEKSEEVTPTSVMAELKQNYGCDCDDPDESDDEESATSILEPVDIDEARAVLNVFGLSPNMIDVESKDSADDVINALGLDAKKPTVTVPASVPAKTREVVSNENPQIKPEISFEFDNKSHVVKFTDGVRTFNFLTDVLPQDSNPLGIDIDDFRDLFENMVYSSVPTAVVGWVEFKMNYLFNYTFTPCSPFRFMRVWETEDKAYTMCYTLQTDYKERVEKIYNDLVEIGKCEAVYKMIRNIVCGTMSDYRMNILINGPTSINPDVLHVMYGRTQGTLAEIIKSNPNARRSPSEEHLHSMAEFLKRLVVDFKDTPFCIDMTPPTEVSDEPGETDDDIPTLAPNSEEERNVVLKAFGRSDEPDDSEDDEDGDEDISKFLNDLDDGDDDGFIMNVKD